MEDGDQPYPRLVEALLSTRVLKVSCGGWHTIALCDDGVYSFGYVVVASPERLLASYHCPQFPFAAVTLARRRCAAQAR